MVKQKSKSPKPVSGGDTSGLTSAKASQVKDETEAGRSFRRLKKGVEVKETAAEARRRADEEAIEKGFGVFQYKDDEGPASGKKSNGKLEDQKITKFIDKSGKSSRKEKAEIQASEKKRLEEKKKARKKRQQDSDDEWNLGGVDLEDDDNELEVLEDSDEEIIRQITKNQKKQNGNENSNIVQNGSKSRPRGRDTNSKGMDIEEPEVVRGAKDTTSNRRGRNSTADIEIEAEKRKASVSKEPASTKKTKKASIKKEATMDAENEITGPLSGMNIVLTGLFTCVGGDNKEALIEVIKILGGRSTGSVSGKTSMLIGGYQLPDGRETNQSNKYKAAKEKKVKILTEDDFEELLKKKTGMTLLELIDGGAKEYANKEFQANLGTQVDKQAAGNSMDIETEGGKPQAQNGAKQLAVSNRGCMMDEEGGKDDKFDPRGLWTDKYAPKRTSEIIGNRGVIDKLRDWIVSWEDVVIHGRKKEVKWKGGFGGGNPSLDNPNARAALLSGSPGIGKTSTVRLLCKELGYNLIEQNASDIRNKNAVKDTFSSLGDSMSLTARGDVVHSIILMDEVDGMSSDRGGSAALNEFIKKTKVPIICVCNDRSHPKMRTLAGNCYDLKFSKPPRPSIVERVRQIVAAEVS